MKKKYILFLFLCLMGMTAKAQSLAQAKALYERGEYAKAKPTFKRFAKSQPGNGNYCLWYGVCCLKTNEADVSVKYLETAVKKRIPSGQLYLAQAYHTLYRFEDAIKVYEDYIADLTKRKRPTNVADSLLAQSKMGLRLLKGVEEVNVIDSIIIDKSKFLSVYKISQESGTLYTHKEFFKDETDTDGIVYETELGNKLYYAEKAEDGTLSILSSNKMEDGWSTGVPLPGSINEAANANYPYVMTDGITIYYAADGAGSLGGYDIFVTRYNTANDTYLNPENVGMPFNSPFNDYMYVIDEFNNLGWFATDRYQPEGKVCIYVFIPNSSKRVYNYENMDEAKMKRLAWLHSISETWIDQNAVAEAKQRLQETVSERPTAEKSRDFEFVINDQVTYYHLNDFRSPKAKELFGKYRQLDKRYKKQENELENQRSWYMRANEQERKDKTPGMIDLEKRLEQLTYEMKQTAILIRNEEIPMLKN